MSSRRTSRTSANIRRAVALPRTDDPYLLGYSMTDCPIFTNLDAAPRIENDFLTYGIV